MPSRITSHQICTEIQEALTQARVARRRVERLLRLLAVPERTHALTLVCRRPASRVEHLNSPRTSPGQPIGLVKPPFIGA
jgi:hypothetical protein